MSAIHLSNIALLGPHALLIPVVLLSIHTSIIHLLWIHFFHFGHMRDKQNWLLEFGITTRGLLLLQIVRSSHLLLIQNVHHGLTGEAHCVHSIKTVICREANDRDRHRILIHDKHWS